ncbi:BCCT transporter family protein, partial [Vibrio parahaemolyticus V-223/04]
STK